MNKEVNLEKLIVVIERRSQMTAIPTPATKQTCKIYNKSPCLKPGTLTFYNRTHHK